MKELSTKPWALKYYTIDVLPVCIRTHTPFKDHNIFTTTFMSPLPGTPHSNTNQYMCDDTGSTLNARRKDEKITHIRSEK